MPKISALNTIAQLSTSSILPVVDDNQTQKVTLKRVIEFVSASIDVTFATEIELLQSASSITSSLNAFASASILNVNTKLSTSSFEAYTASVSSANTSSLLTTSSFNTYTSSNNTTNTTQNSRLTALENNSGSYLLKTQTGSFALTSSNNFTGKQTFSDVIYASQIQNLSGSVYILTSGNNVEIQGSNLVVPNGGIITSFNVSASSFTGSIDWNYIQNSPSLITSSNQITNLGFATTSSLAVVTPFLSSSTFNSYTSSNDSKWNTLGGQTGSFITEAETGSFATTGSNTFKATQTIAGNLFLSSSFPLVYNNSSANNMLFGLFDGSTIHGAYYQIFGNTYPNITQRGGAEFVYDVRNNPNADFHIASFNGSSWTPKFVVNDNGAQVTGSLNVSDGITGSLDWINLINIPNGIVSGSSQIVSLLPNGVVSGSSQILDGTGIYSSSNQLPSGVVSGSSQVLDGSNIISSSTQISEFGFVSGSYETTGRGIISSSAQLPSGLVSGSSQVLGDSGIISSSTQITYLGFISSSNDVTPFLSSSAFNTFTSSLSGTISSSAQISALGYATTSSILNIDTSSLVTTSSFNTFTSSYVVASESFDSRINAIVSAGVPAGTISGSTQILNLGFATTSSVLNIDTSSLVTTSSFNSFSASIHNEIVAATNEQDLSYLVTTSSFNTYTASISTASLVTAINNLTAATSSYETKGSGILSGSIVFISSSAPSSGIGSLWYDDTIGNLYLKYDTNVWVDTSNGVIETIINDGSVLTTASFNSWTASYVAPVPNGTISGSSQITSLGFVLTSSFEPFSASVNTATSSLNSFTSSINTTIKNKLNADNVLSGSISYGSLTGIPSGIVSSSTQIIAGLPSGTVSGSSQVLSGTNIVSSSTQITTLGFATTGSQTLSGNQTVNGNLVVTGSITAQSYIVSSSVYYVTESSVSGSSNFGNSLDDNHNFTGSVYVSGSLTISGSLNLSPSASLGARLWQLSDVRDSITGSADGYLLSYSSASGDWVAAAGATAKGTVRLYIATQRANASAFYFNANTRTASDSASPSADSAFMVTTNLLSRVTVYLRQDNAGPNSTIVGIGKNADGAAFSSATLITSSSLSLGQNTIQTWQFSGLTLNTFDSLHIYCDPTSTPGTMYGIVIID